MKTISILQIALLFASPVTLAQQPSDNPIDRKQATAYFAEAKQILAEDGGALWGTSLDGPLIFVDAASRHCVANQQDAKQVLQQVDEVYIGQLPADVMVANTAVDWSGTKWTMCLWPLPENADARAVLLAHESWHRVQDRLRFPSSGASNAHLATLQGRYLIQLEWRALATAMENEHRRAGEAVADALIFRKRRHDLFESAQGEEREMELHEGLAEYTGVTLALDDRGRRERTIKQLRERPAQLKTLVRSSAYLSGPAYGILLDQAQPGWLKNLSATDDLGQVLSEVYNVELPQDLETAVAIRSKLYDGAHLWNAEKRRDDERRALLARYVKKFTADSRLVLPLVQMKMSFNPNELVPLDNLGTVYPTLELTDSWGVLTVTGGALIAADFQSVTVSVPASYADELSTSTDEWKLELSPGWIIVPEDGRVYRAKQNE